MRARISSLAVPRCSLIGPTAAHTIVGLDTQKTVLRVRAVLWSWHVGTLPRRGVSNAQRCIKTTRARLAIRCKRGLLAAEIVAGLFAAWLSVSVQGGTIGWTGRGLDDEAQLVSPTHLTRYQWNGAVGSAYYGTNRCSNRAEASPSALIAILCVPGERHHLSGAPPPAASLLEHQQVSLTWEEPAL